MRLKFALSAVGTATVLALAGCGGGDGGGGGFPFIPPQASTPAEKPAAPVVEPVVEPEAPPVVETTWKDADCAQTGTDLPKCTVNFSDNQARAAIATDPNGNAIHLSTDTSAALAATPSSNNEVKGNVAALGLTFLHQMKLSDFPGISFDALEGGSAPQSQLFANVTLSLNCDGVINTTTPYVNLVLRPSFITPQPSSITPGYTYFAAKTTDAVWLRSGSTSLTAPDGVSVVLNAQNNNTDSTALSLDALIAAYPNACVYDYANPSPNADKITPTPAVMFKLGSGNNLSAMDFYLKNIKIGDKVVF